MVGTDEEDLFSSGLSLSLPLSISVVMVSLSVSVCLPLREIVCVKGKGENYKLGLTREQQVWLFPRGNQREGGVRCLFSTQIVVGGFGRAMFFFFIVGEKRACANCIGFFLLSNSSI